MEDKTTPVSAAQKLLVSKYYKLWCGLQSKGLAGDALEAIKEFTVQLQKENDMYCEREILFENRIKYLESQLQSAPKSEENEYIKLNRVFYAEQMELLDKAERKAYNLESKVYELELNVQHWKNKIELQSAPKQSAGELKTIDELTEDDLIELWAAIGGTPHLFEYGKDDLKRTLITGETVDKNDEPNGLQLDYYTMAAIVDTLRERGFQTLNTPIP